jgi:molybdopterin-guanine dinucleotide biosynthesis protein A
MMQIDVTGVLLAGGNSRRMGEDKRYLVVGEQTLLERGLAVLRSIFQEVLVVIAQDSLPLNVDARVVRDLVPDCGSLGGLYTGLTQATTPYIFVVACDMPFLDPAVITQFTSRRASADIVMAKLAARLHPMHALYGKDDPGTTAQDPRDAVAPVPPGAICHRGGSAHHRSLRAFLS